MPHSRGGLVAVGVLAELSDPRGGVGDFGHGFGREAGGQAILPE